MGEVTINGLVEGGKATSGPPFGPVLGPLGVNVTKIIEEINKLVEVKNLSQMIEKGDTVEFTSGPFKGYKAKVIKVEPAKEEITVELMDVAVPIPVTTKASIARVVQKAEKI